MDQLATSLDALARETAFSGVVRIDDSSGLRLCVAGVLHRVERGERFAALPHKGPGVYPGLSGGDRVLWWL